MTRWRRMAMSLNVLDEYGQRSCTRAGGACQIARGDARAPEPISGQAVIVAGGARLSPGPPELRPVGQKVPFHVDDLQD
jgi:hypothetical protein